MIYNVLTKQMIITPPKTGTTVLHHLLCKMPNFWYILGPARWDTTTKHAPAKVIQTHEIKVEEWILMVRNPIDRLISMWKHRKSYDGYYDGLEDFINHHNLGLGWYAPCTSYIDRIDGVIRQENLYEDCMSVLTKDDPRMGEELMDDLKAVLERLKDYRMNDSQFEHIPTEDEAVLLQHAAETFYSEDLRVGGYEIRTDQAEPEENSYTGTSSR
jgi:hypothetical protein